MDVWTATCWPPYDYHYGAYDKIHPFRQGYPYQQYPVYRVPPVYHPARTSSITEQYPYSKSGVTTPPRHAPEFLPLDGSSSRRRQQRCQVSPGGQKTAGGKEEETGRGAPDGGETNGGFRRDSTPDSPSSDQADARSYCRVLTFQDQNGQHREMVFPKALDLDRPKRARTSFTSYQLERLEREFKCNQYMVGRDRARLASNLDLTETQVKVWFQNRRTKFKRERCRAAEFQEKNAESIAACNILRLLQDKQRDATIAPSVGPISPVQSRLTSW